MAAKERPEFYVYNYIYAHIYTDKITKLYVYTY